MPELDDRQLDLAIRDLVGRAAADAPSPPSIDDLGVRPIRLEPDDDRDRRRWIVTGIAGMSIAAAVIGLLVMGRPDDTAEAPATESTTLPTAAPTLAPTTVPVTEPPVVVTGPEESTPAPTTVPTTTPTTTTPPVAATDEVIMIAGYDGIVVDDGTTLTPALEGTGADTARRVPDGRIFFQHRDLDPAGVYVVDGGGVSEVAMPRGFPGAPILHDVAVVGGEVVLLVESSPGGCQDPNTCLGSVWAIQPDTGAATMVEESNVWESDWSALSLSDTGVIVGTWSADASYGMYSRVLPGVDAQPVDADALGVEADYVDCSTCPKAFTIDRTGRFVGWLVTADDGTIGLVAKDVTGSGTTVGYVVGDANSIPTFPTLEISGIDAPGGNPVGRAIVGDSDPDAVDGARVFDLSDPSYEPIVIGKAGERMAFSS
jgi:hypothetical protein